MQRNPNSVIILLFCLLFCILFYPVLSCKKSNVSDYPVRKTVYKDSLHITYTFKEWTRQNYAGYGASILGDTLFYLATRFETFDTYYSPDSLKLIAFVSQYHPDVNKWKEKKWTPDDMSYNIVSIVGFRDSINQPWNLTDLQLLILEGFKSKEVVLNQFRDYHFNKMSDFLFHINVVDSTYGKPYVDKVPIEMKKLLGDNPDSVKCYERTIGYNLGDSLFWSKSLLWQKGSRLPNLYVFQVKNCIRSIEGKLWGGKPWDSRIKLPIINYPDTIIQMYR